MKVGTYRHVAVFQIHHPSRTNQLNTSEQLAVSIDVTIIEGVG